MLRIAFLKIPNISIHFLSTAHMEGVIFWGARALEALDKWSFNWSCEPTQCPMGSWQWWRIRRWRFCQIIEIVWNCYDSPFFPWNFRIARSSLLQKLELWSKFLGRLFEVIVFHSEPLVISSHPVSHPTKSRWAEEWEWCGTQSGGEGWWFSVLSAVLHQPGLSWLWLF